MEQVNKIFTLKALDNSEDGNNIEGIATSFGNTDKVGDIMQAGCLDKYIEKFNAGETNILRILKMHDRSSIIGKWNSLEVVGDNAIIKGSILTDTTDGKDTLTLIKKGLLNSLSIGFKAIEYEVLPDDEDKGYWFPPYLYKEIELIEASIVDDPANDKAVIQSVKNYKGLYDLKVLEKALREVGLSNKEATAFVSAGKVVLSGRTIHSNKDEVLTALQSFKL